MSDINVNLGDNGRPLALDTLPKTALQAIYHIVTGKTENLSRTLKGNVVIKSSDFDRLFHMFREQIEQYTVECEPTVTVVVKGRDDRSTTYSSWERFQILKVNNHEMTSDITLKLEFVLRLPNTPAPQRCVVSVLLDSALPVIRREKSAKEAEPFGFFFFLRSDWQTVQISVDFVDFLVAKAFTSVVQEWFHTLSKTPGKPLNLLLIRMVPLIRRVLGQFGRLGMAVFLAAYYLLSDGHITLPSSVLAAAIGLLLWSLFSIAESFITPAVLSRIAKNIVPTVILISDTDTIEYNAVLSELNSDLTTLLAMFLTIASTIGLNILSSYIYASVVTKH